MKKVARITLILSSIILALNLGACKNKTTNTNTHSYATESYHADWLEVEKMESKGMGKSIVEKTDAILQKAVDEQNAVQIFKALAYRSKYINKIEEDAQLKILTAFESQTITASEPLKSLLHSATAELYNQYFEQNRWRFQNRSETVDFNEKDVRSLSLHKIQNHIVFHYRKSLQSTTVLQNTPLEKFDEILLISDSNSISYRPTFYEFLADRALEYFKRDDGSITTFDKNIKRDTTLFLPAKKFTVLSFEIEDTTSNRYNALRIFQNLETYHLKINSENMLLERELERLEYVTSIVNLNRKTQLHLSALNRLESEYNHENLPAIWFAKAQLYYQLGRSNKTINFSEGALIKVMKLCNKIEEAQTAVSKNASILKGSILQKQLSIELPKVSAPKMGVSVGLRYRNYDKLYFRLYKIPVLQERPNRAYLSIKERMEQMEAHEIHRQWVLQLPPQTDYQTHDYTTKIEGLELGNYLLFASADSTFNVAASTVAINDFQLSNIAYFSRNTTTDQLEVYLRDRERGTAINKGKLHLIKAVYDKNSRDYFWENKESYTANKEGYLIIDKAENKRYSFCITDGEDSLLTNYFYYYSPSYNTKGEVLRSYLFTDRAIYRPGQLVHFKGIVVKTEDGKKAVKANYTQEIKLFNVNGESLYKMEVTSNDYGSYHGTFTLPKGDLKGEYRIQDQHGSHYFSVEDYKRPTFEIVFDSTKQTYKLDEEVTVSGKVERYAGGQLGDSEIKYHVVRRSRFPFWHWQRPVVMNQTEAEIANGQLQTDVNGCFSFDFLAEASDNTVEGFNPIENFEIYLEATAPNGEVQSSSKTIHLGQQAIYLSTNIESTTTIEKLQKLVVFAKNNKQQEVDLKLSLELWKLSGDSENLETFKKSHLYLTNEVSSNEVISLDKALKAGTYMVDIKGKDRFGQAVSIEQRFILYDEQETQPPAFKKLWFQPLVENVEVGEVFSFLLGSSWENLELLYEVEHLGKIIHSEWLRINEEQKKLSIDVPEKFRGGFSIHINGVQQNEFIQTTHQVVVPYTNKQLKLKLETYRDLVEAGSEEKWTLSISGSKGEKVEAELLLGMYSQDLDVFRKQSWEMNLHGQQSTRLSWRSSAFGNSYARLYGGRSSYNQPFSRMVYPRLNWFGFHMGANHYYRYGEPMLMTDKATESVPINEFGGNAQLTKEDASLLSTNEITKEQIAEEKTKTIQLRKDFRETAFFYPAKYNEKDGSLSFEFIMPDALTKWKFTALAHTKFLEVGMLEYSIRSQKKLMIFPNLPRFFRMGDRFYFSSSIENNSESVQSGTVSLQFFDAENNREIDVFVADQEAKSFKLSPFTSQSHFWEIKIPEKVKILKYQIVAKGDDFSDGQEGVIPVLPRKKLVTESLPLPIRSNSEKLFSFPALLKMEDTSLEPTSFTIELSANPAWYAVQALPYLSDANPNNPEQLFHQIFANSIAQKIVNEQKRIKEVFASWSTLNSDEMLSKLEQNKELKEILLEETPWLREAKNETEQKGRIALLFEANQMRNALSQASNQLLDLQLPDGGWPWFKSMRSSPYITALIVEGFGRLKQMDIQFDSTQKMKSALEAAIVYLDETVLKEYQKYWKLRSNKNGPHLGATEVQYLYLRSFFQEIAIKDSTAFIHYMSMTETDWKNQSMMMKASLAIALHRLQDKNPLAEQILLSLKDHAIEDEEMGMYWKNNNGGRSWYTAKVESQAMMIAAFNEVLNDKQSVEEMKVWLLKQKQTQAWEGNRATALAIYSLLMEGENLLVESGELSVIVGNNQLNTSESSSPGTAYLKKRWESEEITPDMGEIKLKNSGKSIAWGAAYLQYYQDFDQLEEVSESGLKVSKDLFKVIRTKSGKKISPIDRNELRLGDRLLVRLLIENDRDMDFVHLKDLPAMALEPVTILSAYRSQDGLYYYQSVSDASTNFFFEHLPRGSYVFEYEMKVTQSGDFGNGAASIQSYYAPEFKAYSKARRIKILVD